MTFPSNLNLNDIFIEIRNINKTTKPLKSKLCVHRKKICDLRGLGLQTLPVLVLVESA